MKSTLSISCGATWLAILGLLGLPAAAGAQDLLGLPGYPHGERIRLDGQLSTNNVPIEARTFNTRDDFRTVMAYYYKALHDRGLKVVTHHFGISKGYVGYFDAESGTMRLATVMTDPKSYGCMIILSSMDPRPLLDTEMRLPDGLPTVTGAHNVVFNNSTEQQTLSQTITYRAPGELAQVQAALMQSAGELGWQIDAGAQDIAGSISLKRGKSSCMIRLATDHSDPQQAAVLINMLVLRPAEDSSRSAP